MTERKGAGRKKLLRQLMKAPVSNVRFSGNSISLGFFGRRIRDKVVLKKESHVGEWSRRAKAVFVDREFTADEMKKSFRALCVHEALEKFLVEKLHLKLDEEAHAVATKKEKEFLEKTGGNWRSHEMLVYWDWHRQGER